MANKCKACGDPAPTKSTRVVNNVARVDYCEECFNELAYGKIEGGGNVQTFHTSGLSAQVPRQRHGRGHTSA